MTTLHSDSHWLHDVSGFLQSARLPLIVLLGPTASGKTGLSIELAGFLKTEHGRSVEIVNADSRQCYCHLDIGTAKITTEEMQGVPHHLLSVLDPKQECTIAWYQREATRIFGEIHASGNVPLLTGGSMLYISAIVDGLRPMASDPALRAKLGKEYDMDGGVSLHARLAAVDPETAAVIPRQNKVYLVRAMEIFTTTGTPKSISLRTDVCPYDLLMIGVRRSREDIMKRIDNRAHLMLRTGWVDEVRSLLEQGYEADDPGLKSHGYPEIAAALAGGTDPLLAEAAIAAKTRQYAKRQMTWWRGDERIRWIDR